MSSSGPLQLGRQIASNPVTTASRSRRSRTDVTLFWENKLTHGKEAGIPRRAAAVLADNQAFRFPREYVDPVSILGRRCFVEGVSTRAVDNVGGQGIEVIDKNRS